MFKYKSEYSQWFWSECDELNKDTNFAHSLAEKAWNHKQAEIDELRKRIDEAILALEKKSTGLKGLVDNYNKSLNILKGKTNEQ